MIATHTMELIEKLTILADAAKYDASCASSAAPKRSSQGKTGLGATNGMGICHSFTPDGRCVSLLKILLTNFCLYDCHYCVNRRSSNVPRARFTAEEVVRLTMDFYRRNYVSGLFLSSGIIQSVNYTMEQLVLVARLLREKHAFRGYIHLKTIPDADPLLIQEAGRYADRLSVNIELPTEQGLTQLAPEKNIPGIQQAMQIIHHHKQDEIENKRPPLFAPAGQSTQMIIGADAADDHTVLRRAETLYQKFSLKRVYYSAFSPIPDSPRTVPFTAPPLLREHRLYQADFLIRSYGFGSEELLPTEGNLSLDIDPKLGWALANRELFPVDLNRAGAEVIARVPGIGLRTTERLIELRRERKIRYDDLIHLRCVLSKARPFVITSDYHPRQGRHQQRLPATAMCRKCRTATNGAVVVFSPHCNNCFDLWRHQARLLLSHDIAPACINWDGGNNADLLATDTPLPEQPGPHPTGVPAELIGLLEQASRYRGEQRWNFLYQILWQVSRGNRAAMLAGDAGGSELHRRIRLVRRETHHLHAFLRFRPLGDGQSQQLPGFVAWHEPAHDILATASEHFVHRMGLCRWLIATPEDGVFYDGEKLLYRKPCPPEWQELARHSPGEEKDNLWLAYYESIFNPARTNAVAIRQHMPTRFWKNLPEGSSIPKLLQQARHGKQQDGQALAVSLKTGKRIKRADE